jgi:hypothetical protein
MKSKKQHSSGGIKMSKRCNICSKKLNFAERALECKCQGTFCYSHRPAPNHSCTYAYKTEYQRIIRKALPQVIRKKIEKI